jgi:hypothetical protein
LHFKQIAVRTFSLLAEDFRLPPIHMITVYDYSEWCEPALRYNF